VYPENSTPSDTERRDSPESEAYTRLLRRLHRRSRGRGVSRRRRDGSPSCSQHAGRLYEANFGRCRCPARHERAQHAAGWPTRFRLMSTTAAQGSHHRPRVLTQTRRNRALAPRRLTLPRDVAAGVFGRAKRIGVDRLRGRSFHRRLPIRDSHGSSRRTNGSISLQLHPGTADTPKGVVYQTVARICQRDLQIGTWAIGPHQPLPGSFACSSKVVLSL